MSVGNVEIVRRLYDAVARRDTDSVLARYHPDVELDKTHGPAQEMIGGVRRGREALRAFWRDWHEAWANVDYNVTELIDAGEHVVSVGNYRGRGRASGVEVEGRTYHVYTLRDGKCVRMDEFAARSEALEAAGLRE